LGLFLGKEAQTRGGIFTLPSQRISGTINIAFIHLASQAYEGIEHKAG
jgi:hypothetical protein